MPIADTDENFILYHEFVLPAYIPQMLQMASWVIHHLFEMCHARKENYMAINLYISLLGLAASRKG